MKKSICDVCMEEFISEERPTADFHLLAVLAGANIEEICPECSAALETIHWGAAIKMAIIQQRKEPWRRNSTEDGTGRPAEPAITEKE